MKQFDILLHPRTKSFIETFISNPRQSILFVAEKGFGKSYIMEYVVHLFNARGENILNVMPSETSSISIDEIRKIKDFLKLKTNEKGVKRFVLIHDADSMTEEAQNAVLKILEEPPQDCIFLLSTSKVSGLLATILSRTEVHELSKPPLERLLEYVRQLGINEQDEAKTIAISNGLPALAVCITNGSSTDFLASIDAAKKFMTSTVFERLQKVDELSKDRPKSLLFLEALNTIVKAGMNHQIIAGQKVAQWESRAHQIMKTRKLIESNVSTKLSLTDLAISI